jgi:hypothetical protein
MRTNSFAIRSALVSEAVRAVLATASDIMAETPDLYVQIDADASDDRRIVVDLDAIGPGVHASIRVGVGLSDVAIDRHIRRAVLRLLDQPATITAA